MYPTCDRIGMSTDSTEYLIVPWGTGTTETDVLTVELPSRELIAQLEVPRETVERMTNLGNQHDITTERALAERLEINRANVSLLAARAVDDVTEIREHLRAAREYLAGVEHLQTDDVESEIERIWTAELE